MSPRLIDQLKPRSLRLAQLSSTRQNRLKYRLFIIAVGADNMQDLARRFFPLKPRLHFSELTDFVDGNDSLRRKCFSKCNLAIRKGRDFAAWAGLTPKQNSTGGKTRLGRTSKMGQKDIRRLLILGAMSVIQATQRKGGATEGSWLDRMLKRKPKLLVAVALANKMARMAWALMKNEDEYRVQLAA